MKGPAGHDMDSNEWLDRRVRRDQRTFSGGVIALAVLGGIPLFLSLWSRLVVAFSPHPATHPKSGALNGGIHLTGSSCVICLMAPRSCQMPDDKIAICCCRSFATEAPPSSCSSHRPLSKQHQKKMQRTRIAKITAPPHQSTIVLIHAG
jgi:hypothetical protein